MESLWRCHGDALAARGLFRELPQEGLQVAFLLEDAEEAVDGNALLLHSIAIADGDGVVLQGLVVDGDAVRGTDGILAAVAFTDGVFLVILAVEVEAQVVHDGTCYFGQSVFLDQRHDGQFYRSQCGRQAQHYAGFAVLEFLLAVAVAHDAQEHAVNAD